MKAKLQKEIYELIRKPDSSKFSVIEFLDGRIVERFTAVLNKDEEVLGRVLFYRDITDPTVDRNRSAFFRDSVKIADERP